MNSLVLASDKRPGLQYVSSPVTTGPVGKRRAPAPRTRWLLATFIATLLHVTILAIVFVMPHQAVTTAPEQASEVVMLVTEPVARDAPTVVSPPMEQPADVAEPPPPRSSTPPAPEPTISALLPESAEPPSVPVAAEPPAPPLMPAAEPPAVSAVAPEPAPKPVQPHAVAHPAPVAKRIVPTAPPAGSAGSVEHRGAAQPADALERYRTSLAAHVRAFQTYPALARARRQEGLVVVHVKVERNGRIIGMAVEQGSGSALLDHEALATLKRAEPMPLVPAGVPGLVIDLVFPLHFALD